MPYDPDAQSPSYISAKYVLDNPGGYDPEELLDLGLDGICKRASRMCDAHARTKFHYQAVVDEHRWGGASDFYFYLDYWPIRGIDSFKIVTGIYNGALQSIPLDPSNVELTPESDRGQAALLWLQLGTVPPIAASIEPVVKVAYRAGYDAGCLVDGTGTVTTTPSAPDGLVLPYPWWLQQATYETAMELVDTAYTRRIGLAAATGITIGPYSVQRRVYPPRTSTRTPKSGIPELAADLLDSNFTRVDVGSVDYAGVGY